VRSWIDDVAAVAGGARMKGLLEVALGGIVAGAQRNTSEGFAVTGKWARHTFCAGRVQKGMQQMLENLIAGCGRRLAGMVASSARLP
jgi:hypothetical protein